MWIDALKATIDKDRMGTHWADCYLEHRDCAILRLIDYAVQLECENKALSVNAENLEIVRKQRDETTHDLRISEERARLWERKTYEAWRDCDEARDIARKLLVVAKALRGEYNLPFSFYPRVLAALLRLPEWLRGEIEGMHEGHDEDCPDCVCGHGADRHNNADSCDICECKEYQG